MSTGNYVQIMIDRLTKKEVLLKQIAATESNHYCG